MYNDPYTVPEPKETPRFQSPTGYNYIPVDRVVSWEWSTTFGRWGAVVVFPDGQRWFTWPEPQKLDTTDNSPPSLSVSPLARGLYL